MAVKKATSKRNASEKISKILLGNRIEAASVEQKIKLQEHFLMVDEQSLIPRREIETLVLIADFPLKTNELEDKK